MASWSFGEEHRTSPSRRSDTLAILLATIALASPNLSIAVNGNHLVDGRGKTVRLLGVNRSSFEYACAQGWGFNEGPTDDASIAAMKRWRINVVRLPLNEACWLGLTSVKPEYRGAPYRSAVISYVHRLNAAGLYVILDLHWNAPAAMPALGQQPMADADHSPAFWRSVATTFKQDRAVLFDVYNEPHDISWACWRNGCGQWAGMRQLVRSIRATGATQPIMLGGIGWAGDLSGWLAHRPAGAGLVASVHDYNFGGCPTQACWDATIAPVAARVPVVTGELGENDCAHGFVDAYMSWADRHGISYLGWTWNPWNCNSGPALISDWSGTPTAFGLGLRDHLAG